MEWREEEKIREEEKRKREEVRNKVIGRKKNKTGIETKERRGNK